jgi:hypothetical protein
VEAQLRVLRLLLFLSLRLKIGRILLRQGVGVH